MRSYETLKNELRVISCEMINKAKSGHTGIALGAAPIFEALFCDVLDYDTQNDKSIFRDRFVNSAGHSSALMYATLNAMGFKISKNDLMKFRQLNSKTPGHPEVNVTPGVDCSTGPLGQGIANAVGMAMAGKHYASLFNEENFKLFDSKVYCFCGDGCLMEGISYEALSLAGTLKLNNLVLIYDRNKTTIEGSTDITFTENIEMRFKAINFETITVKNGNSVESIIKALKLAKKANKPTLVIIETAIGYGSKYAGDCQIHGKPLNDEEVKTLKQDFGVNNKPFEFSQQVKEFCHKKARERADKIQAKEKLLETYKISYPKKYAMLLNYITFGYNEIILKNLVKIDTKNDISTRDMNFNILNKIGKTVKNFVGGCADVNASTKAFFDGEPFMAKNSFYARNIHFGVREHSMAAICNGMALFGGLNAFASTFFTFSDYLKPALRMSGLMNLPVLYIFTHDSFMIGEDGPTHQCIEQLWNIRAIPNITLFRCYNNEEILAAYNYYFKTQKPTVIVLSKHVGKTVSTSLKEATKGGYIVSKEENKLNLQIVATGMEVETALNVQEILKKDGINARVVSMPSANVFKKQNEAYKNKVLDNTVKTVLIEAGNDFGWEVILNKIDLYISLNDFGKSGKPQELKKYFGFDEETIVKKIKTLLSK